MGGEFVDRQTKNSNDVHSALTPSLVPAQWNHSDRAEGLSLNSPIAFLISALNDPDLSVREDAIEILGDRGDPEGVPGLQSALYSEEPWLKLSAIEALSDIGTNEAAMALAGIGRRRCGDA